MFTEKIAVELAAIARKDSLSKVKLYAAINQGPALYKRLNKITPLPGPYMKGDAQYLRMMYTSCRWWIDVHGDK